MRQDGPRIKLNYLILFNKIILYFQYYKCFYDFDFFVNINLKEWRLNRAKIHINHFVTMK